MEKISILKDGAEYIVMIVAAAVMAVYAYCYYQEDAQVGEIIDRVLVEFKNINNL